jgi:hypothetical protein
VFKRGLDTALHAKWEKIRENWFCKSNTFLQLAKGSLIVFRAIARKRLSNTV